MTYLAVLIGLLILCTFWYLRWIYTQFDLERTKWYEERQILLNRIQDPQYKPLLSPTEKQANVEEIKRLREEAEQMGLVGQIVE